MYVSSSTVLCFDCFMEDDDDPACASRALRAAPYPHPYCARARVATPPTALAAPPGCVVSISSSEHVPVWPPYFFGSLLSALREVSLPSVAVSSVGLPHSPKLAEGIRVVSSAQWSPHFATGHCRDPGRRRAAEPAGEGPCPQLRHRCLP